MLSHTTSTTSITKTATTYTTSDKYSNFGFPRDFTCCSFQLSNLQDYEELGTFCERHSDHFPMVGMAIISI